MPEIAPVELSIADVARLLHVQPQTVQRRLRAGELEQARTIGDRPGLVRLSPADDWIRVEDASALLHVSPATIRAAIKRGTLIGRRDKNGRWRVLLRSVLEDRRCDPEAVEMFAGGQPFPQDPADLTRPPRRSADLHRSVFLRLNAEEAEMLERCRDQHGTIRAAVVIGLQAVDRGEVDVDQAELLAERDLYAGQLDRVRTAHRGLRARAETRLVDEVYCPACEQLVPIEEFEAHDLPDGTQDIYHRAHTHRSGSRFRSNTVAARRAKASLDTPE